MSTPPSPSAVAPVPTPAAEAPAAADVDVAACVIAYEADATIDAVLDAIPERIGGHPIRVYVADDASSDHTSQRASDWVDRCGRPAAEVVRHRSNLGYGGNQI